MMDAQHRTLELTYHNWSKHCIAWLNHKKFSFQQYGGSARFGVRTAWPSGLRRVRAPAIILAH